MAEKRKVAAKPQGGKHSRGFIQSGRPAGGGVRTAVDSRLMARPYGLSDRDAIREILSLMNRPVVVK